MGISNSKNSHHFRLTQISKYIYISPAPGKKTVYHDYDINSNLHCIKRKKINTIVCLLEGSEFTNLKILNYSHVLQHSNFELISYPISDNDIPIDTYYFHYIISMLAERIYAKQKILIHCRAGVGRSSLVTACLLLYLKYAKRYKLVELPPQTGFTQLTITKTTSEVANQSKNYSEKRKIKHTQRKLSKIIKKIQHRNSKCLKIQKQVNYLFYYNRFLHSLIL